MKFANSILEGKAILATDITPTKQDRFDCVECALPVTYRQGSESKSAHFAHPPGSWGVDCSLMASRNDNKWRKSAKENYQSVKKLVKLKHITKKQALKVVKRVVEYVDEENRGWASAYSKLEHRFKTSREQIAEKDSEIYSLKLDQDTVDEEKEEKIKFLNRQLHEITSSITWTESKQHLLDLLLQGEYKSAEILKNIS